MRAEALTQLMEAFSDYLIQRAALPGTERALQRVAGMPGIGCLPLSDITLRKPWSNVYLLEAYLWSLGPGLPWDLLRESFLNGF